MHAVLLITAPSTEEARAIGRALVESRLAAGVNVVPGVQSVFWWEGAVCEADEAALWVKTKSALIDKVVNKVRSMHSYDCPCIVALPIEGGHAEYLDWIENETG